MNNAAKNTIEAINNAYTTVKTPYDALVVFNVEGMDSFEVCEKTLKSHCGFSHYQARNVIRGLELLNTYGPMHEITDAFLASIQK